MIKANELRINNYVKDSGGKILQIDWIERDKVCMKVMIEGIEVHPLTEHLNSIEPIPLTEEWLLKFGFKYMHHIAYDKGLLSIYIPDKIHPNGRVYFNSWAILNEMPKYVHQLQNLYFALTGSELTSK